MDDINLIKQRINCALNKIYVFKNDFDYYNKKKYLNSIKKELASINSWENISRAKKLSKKISHLESFIKPLDQIYRSLIDLNNLIDLSNRDFSLIKEIQNQLNLEESMFSKLEIYKMFSKKNDNCDCYIDIQSGSGGIEAQDWANMLLRMYLRWLNNKGFSVNIITESLGEISGIKSITLKVVGLYAYGWLRTESGIHRLVRKSPFDSGNKRHTSFASVFVYPDIDDTINICIRMEDLRFDFYRASGAGGQHVNRTESAVRITHIPTNIVTQCQSGRSQHKNKLQAMKQLKAKLYNFELQKKNSKKKIKELEKNDITWGNQIRSYVLDDSRIKDLRTGLEKRSVKSVLDGDLDDFIKTSLKLL